MANQGAVGKTAVLAIASGTNSTNIANVNSIGIPSASVDAIDITSSDGGTDAPTYKSYLAGLVDGGEFDVEMTFAAAAAAEVYANIAGSTNKKITITFPATSDGEGTTAVTSTFETYGFISGYGGTIPMNDKITQTFTIKCSGGPTFATS